MFRYLSAIGMSEYIDKKKFQSFLLSSFHSQDLSMDTVTNPETGEKTAEFYLDMDPFTLILRGKISENRIFVESLLPVARSYRNLVPIDAWQIDFSDEMMPILIGDHLETGSPIDLFASNLIQAKRYASKGPDILNVYVYGLSISGQILLNTQSSAEDEAAYLDQEEYMDELSRRAASGDLRARQELEQEDRAAWEDIEKRLQDEDVYSIIDGLILPANAEIYGSFTVLGTIRAIHKILNSYTEEWVYEFELSIIGKPYTVFINPKDLEGYPSVGMRFQGSVLLLGNIDWNLREEVFEE